MLHPLHEPVKQNPAHLFLHSIQIIQLVEATPPPRCMSIPSSSYPASSCPSTSTTDSDEDGTSYCSSIVTPDDNREPIPWTDDTYNTRMKRVHDWRDNFVKATSPPVSPPDARPPSLKRKSHPHHADDDAISHSSKRSRSPDGHSISRLTGHPCPACDTLFPSLSSLRTHGHAPDIPEACRVAVEYNFERAPNIPLSSTTE